MAIAMLAGRFSFQGFFHDETDKPRDRRGGDYDGNGHVDLRHSVPDVLASTANLLKTNGWRAGAPFTAGTPNFEVAMREWNHSEVYRKTIVLMAQRLDGG